MEPTRDRLFRAAGVISGEISRASRVTPPWSTATGIAEKTQPLPMEAVMTRMITRSRIALVSRME